MGEVINLNQFKKQKARSEKQKNAENNRILFGTPKSLKEQAKKQNKLEDNLLERKRLEKASNTDKSQNDDNKPKQ